MKKTYTIDKRRELVVPGDQEETVRFAVEHWITQATHAIQKKGSFFVALSGGSTPKKIFQALASPAYKNLVDWSNVYIFWSDERAVPSDHHESNYHMSMVEGKLSTLPLSKNQIFRMHAEDEITTHAEEYETLIKKTLQDHPFDLIMLGMGDDGHTASLFPHTEGLKEEKKWVIANYVPQKKSWRMSFTYPLIERARLTTLYVIGKDKALMLEKILLGPFLPEELPSQRIGSEKQPALWIADLSAAHHLLAHIS